VIYSQIWLNLPRDDHHFGYKQKNLHKKTLTRRLKGKEGEEEQRTTRN
jgi:hypothetical protein